MKHTKRVHWASTFCGPHTVLIFKNAEDSFTDKYEGQTNPPRDVNDVFEIDIGDYVFASPAKFNEVLVHEFVHVLEHIYRKDKEMFSIRSVGNCTALARTIGSGVGEMLTRLEQRPQPKKRKG